MKFAPYVLAAVMTATSSLAAAADMNELKDTPSAGAMLIDLVLVRPVGLVATVIGAAVYVVALPFAVMQGKEPLETAQSLVVEPARYTFMRPLGADE